MSASAPPTPFIIYIGAYTHGLPDMPISSTVTAQLHGVTLVAPITPCGKPGNEYNVPGTWGDPSIDYREFSVNGVKPTSGQPKLVITVNYNIPADMQSWDAVINNVTFMQG
jgi:hypothetical protein